jgi:hypothetical protein
MLVANARACRRCSAFLRQRPPETPHALSVVSQNEGYSTENSRTLFIRGDDRQIMSYCWRTPKSRRFCSAYFFFELRGAWEILYRTVVKDAAWIAELLRHGLLRGRCIPSKPPRQLRELTRYRSILVQDRARVLNRLQAVLEDANLKRASVVTDTSGVSAWALVAAILA